MYDDQGRIVEEYQGEEAEVESYEKKSQKKRQTEDAKKKKEILHGKALEELIRRIASEEAAKTPPKIEHHWHNQYHYDWRPWNGYYWRPYWDGITWTYQYATNLNTAHDGHYTSCVNAADLSQAIGIDSQTVSSVTADASYKVITNNVKIDAADYGEFLKGKSWSGVVGGDGAGVIKLSTGDVSFGSTSSCQVPGAVIFNRN